VPRTRQAITTIKALLAGESPAHIEGLDSIYTEQAVLQAPRPTPIYVGAMGPKMLHMTGRLADGALALCLPPSQYHQVATQIGAGVDAAGRSLDDLDIAACLWCSVDDDADRARSAMAAQIARYAGSLSVDALVSAGQDPDEFAHVASLIAAGRPNDAVHTVSSRMLQLGIVGGANDVIDQCRGLLSEGVRHLSFGPPMGPSPAVALALFRDVVLPALRA
jgi:5,10-methylenetetrahydromethanopterin reductase